MCVCGWAGGWFGVSLRVSGAAVPTTPPHTHTHPLPPPPPCTHPPTHTVVSFATHPDTQHRGAYLDATRHSEGAVCNQRGGWDQPCVGRRQGTAARARGQCVRRPWRGHHSNPGSQPPRGPHAPHYVVRILSSCTWLPRSLMHACVCVCLRACVCVCACVCICVCMLCVCVWAQGVAGWLSNSPALIADAVHSLSDLASDVVTAVTVYYSRQPADENHPYGHGKVGCSVPMQPCSHSHAAPQHLGARWARWHCAVVLT